MNRNSIILLVTVAAWSLLAARASWAQTPLTLEQCRRMALESNKLIQIAGQNVEAAKANREATEAGALPKVDAGAVGLVVGPELNNLLPKRVFSPNVGISMPLYAGGQVRNGSKLARLGVDVQEEEKVLTTSEVLLKTDRAYWQVVAVKEKIVLAQRYRALLDTLADDLNNAYQAGTTYKNDLLRAKVQLNEAELQITRARNGLELANLTLAQLIGKENAAFIAVQDSITGPFTSVSEAAAAPGFLANRSEVKLLEKSLQAGELQRRILVGGMLPQISLSGYGLYSRTPRVEQGAMNNSFFSYVGLVNVSIPVFHWGEKRQAVREQTFKNKAQALNLQETREQLSIEIRQALLQLNESARSVALSELSLEQANENLKLSNDRFEAGTITGKDVLEAQAIWQQAYSGVIDAKTQYKINETILQKARGELK